MPARLSPSRCPLRASPERERLFPLLFGARVPPHSPHDGFCFTRGSCPNPRSHFFALTLDRLRGTHVAWRHTSPRLSMPPVYGRRTRRHAPRRVHARFAFTLRTGCSNGRRERAPPPRITTGTSYSCSPSRFDSAKG